MIMIILKTIVIFIMFCGALCTIAPKLHGIAIIFGAIILYGGFTKFASITPETLLLLTVLTIILETGSYLLRIYLNKRYPISQDFAINSSAGNLAGIIAADALVGSGQGIWLWELIAGKTTLPYIEIINKVLQKLAIIALLRVVCGIFIIVWALVYIIK